MKLKRLPKLKRTPRSAAEHISAVGEKGRWPIGDLYHAKLAVEYVREGKGKRSDHATVLRSVRKHYPQYDWNRVMARANSRLAGAERLYRKAFDAAPGGRHLVALYFAATDPSIPLAKKAAALGGTIAGGAAAGSWAAPGVGTLAGGALGFLTGAYGVMVEDRHMAQAEAYLQRGESPNQLKGLLSADLVRTNSRRNGPPDTGLRFYIQVLATLRALQWAYWVAHWKVKGGQFYGDHLLLQHLYEGFAKPIDVMGERIVGAYGSNAIDPVHVGTRALSLLESYSRSLAEEPFRALLQMEEYLGKVVNAAWKTANEAGDLGDDDLFMGFANDQKERIYLLRQRIEGTARTNGGQFKVGSVVAKFTQSKRRRGEERDYSLQVLLDDEWFEVCRMSKPDRERAKKAIRSSQIYEIRANGRRR